MTCFSLSHLMKENLFTSLQLICEEMVMLQGGNFINVDNVSDEVLVICDRNIITAMDDNSLHLCLSSLIKRLSM
jgi:hypothetical protein